MRKKYDGLDGTELAICESQERMAVVVEAQDAPRFMELADQENLEATVVATVTDQGRLTMRWNGNTIVDLSRDFLNTNGVEKHATAITAAPESILKDQVKDFLQGYLDPGGGSERPPPSGACRSGLIPPSAGAACSCPSAASISSPPPRPWSTNFSREEGETDSQLPDGLGL